MFGMLRKRIFSCIASFIAIAAFSGISPQSMWILYEPDIPDALKK